MRFIGQEQHAFTAQRSARCALKIAALSLVCAMTPLAFPALTSAQAGPVETRTATVRLKFHSESKGLSGRYGYVLMDAQTGEVLAERNPDRSFIPASLSKIPTTLMALNALGTEHRFETRLLADGRIDQGVLYGNLHLVGSGDPTLRTRDLEVLSDTLARQGIARITGDFTYNTDALPRSSVIDRAQPADHHYNPAVSGLNVDLNLWRSRGVRKKTTSPGYRAARLFRSAAALRGITLPMPKHFSGDAPGDVVASHISEPVSKIAETMMMNSTNLTAEALGALSISAMGEAPNSLKDAAKATTAWLKEQSDSIGGKGWKSFTLVNHSGLSSKSRATPRQMASILRLGHEKFGETFRSLHAPHKAGGYQAFAMRGKTGSMRFVRGYGGFLSIGGRDLIFTIMSADPTRRALADAGTEGLRSGAWMRKARKLELAVLADWIEEYWSVSPQTLVPSTDPIENAPAVTKVAQSTPTYTVSMAPIADDLYAAAEVKQPTQANLATFVRATRPVE